MKQVTGYQIVDSSNQSPVGKAYGEDKGRNARTKAEKMNMAYGAVRYTVKMLWSD